MKVKGVRVLLIGFLLVMMTGCVSGTMRHVQAVDSSENSIKFLYNEQVADGEWERGVIECELNDDALENCRRLQMEYR